MANEAGTIIGGAASGASMGSAAGPWGTLIGGVLGAGLGVYQAYGQDDEKRPEYNVPDSVKKSLTVAQMRALEGMPEEQRQLFLQNLDRGTQYGLKQLGDRRAGISGVAELNQQRNDALLGLNAQDAQIRSGNQRDYMNQLNTMGEYQDQAFQINKLAPYYEGQAQNQAQMGANVQNIGNSISGLASTYGNNGSYRRGNTSPYAGYGANSYDMGTSPTGYEDASYNPFQNVG